MGWLEVEVLRKIPELYGLQLNTALYKLKRGCIALTTQVSRVVSSIKSLVDKSSFQRDYKDLLKFYDWLKQFNPIDVQDKRLWSLDCWLVAKEGGATNCHNTEGVGGSIQEITDSKCFTDTTIKTSKKIKTLL